jgi:hypothetical protein
MTPPRSYKPWMCHNALNINNLLQRNLIDAFNFRKNTSKVYKTLEVFFPSIKTYCLNIHKLPDPELR